MTVATDETHPPIHLRSIIMKEIAELRAELAALSHVVEGAVLGHRLVIAACLGCLLAGLALGYSAG
jgi:hypothetical protein